jgi:TetR/AcrR family transcriptional regulator, transcriptional repressor for nem operon
LWLKVSPTITKAPEQTRRKILFAAFQEFHKNGFQGGSLNHIIESANTTKGALFHHFAGKDQLGYAVLEEIIEPHLREQWFDPFAKSEDPIADLKRTVQQCTAKCRQSGVLEKGCPLNNLAQEMSPLDEDFRQRIEKIYAAWRDCLERAFARGIKAGTVRKDVSPRNVAAFIVAAQTGIIGTSKNAQSEELMKRAGEAFFEYLDSLRP